MYIGNLITHAGRGIAAAAAVLAVTSFTAPKPAHAIDAGTAVGIGLGSFALGSALGAASNPYYNGYYAPYGGGYYAPPAPYYTPAAPYYGAPRSCWDPYYRRYYAC